VTSRRLTKYGSGEPRRFWPGLSGSCDCQDCACPARNAAVAHRDDLMSDDLAEADLPSFAQHLRSPNARRSRQALLILPMYPVVTQDADIIGWLFCHPVDDFHS
jgi:hypothetical protein